MSATATSRTPMKFYPDVPHKRRMTVLSDVVILALLALFAWIAMTVHDAVDRLAVLGNGVQDGGLSVQNGFGSAADKVHSVPLVGGSLSDALKGAGSDSGGRVAALGHQGAQSAHHLALVMGLVVFGLPAIVVLALLVPRRVRQIRQLTAAAGVLAYPSDPERVRLLAMRAVFALPYATLAAYTSDPFGDLSDGRYDRLVLAALDEAGVRSPLAPPA
jgi:hypothetical protein